MLVFGALLGTQSNREVSIVNSFELVFDSESDVEMGDNGDRRKLNAEFFETRKEQCDCSLKAKLRRSQTGLPDIGSDWVVLGGKAAQGGRRRFTSPSESRLCDMAHTQFVSSIDTPIFLLFDPSAPHEQHLPLKVYEAALAEGAKQDQSDGGFVELEFGIETGEAERIAVDGVSRGAMGGDEDSSGE